MSEMIYTKYEKAQLIGARALQISMGAPFKVELSQDELEQIKYNPIEIAKIELQKGVLPLEIVRKIPRLVEVQEDVTEDKNQKLQQL